MRFIFPCFLILTCLYYPSFGQKNVFENSRAQKLYEKAVLYQLRGEYKKAERFYLRSLENDRGHKGTSLALADFYRLQQRFQEAAEIIKKCNACKSKGDLFLLAEDYFRYGDYIRSSETLNQLSNPSIHLSPEEYAKVDLMKRSISFVRANTHQRMGDTISNPVNMGFRINSEYDEYFPSISLNDSVLVFTRKTNGIDQDFYLAHRDSCGGWFVARPLGSPPNSPSQEGSQMLSADGHYLFFTRCENVSPNGWALGGCDLYFSYDVPGGWSQPVPFGATINTPAYEGMPSLSPDNKILYFVSDREGGFGGKDIWMSRFEDGLWQIPENLGPFINTPGDETAPWISSDNQTLYFTSDGHPGYGGNDIFVVKKEVGGYWGMPVNVGKPINSSSDDVSLIISNDGQKAYFSSNRPGGEGGMDLYEVGMPTEYRPDPRSFLYGIVKDSLTGVRLPNTEITWRSAYTGEILAQYESNKGDASFLFSFPLDYFVALEVNLYGYMTYIDTICVQNQKTFPPDTFNIALLPYYYSPPLRDTNVLTVHFKTNSYELEDSLQTLVQQTIAYFQTGRFNEFYVYGFADISGHPEINESITMRRAAHVRDILLEMGIREDKIQAKGWSDAYPIAPNDTEEGRALNRRVEIIVRIPE